MAIAIALLMIVPWAMTRYRPYSARPGVGCIRTDVPATVNPPFPADMCEPLSSLYSMPPVDLVVDATFRSLALLSGAFILALTAGTLLGVAAALLRRQVLAGGLIVGFTSIITAVPAFFVAYFLQIVVILLAATPGGGRLLPVFGFGYDEHVVLPLLSISVPAVAFTAQITASRVSEVLDADFITMARAKGLRQGWIVAVHVLPHARPVILEGLSSGLRVSVASLPIIEYLFVWRGIGQLAFEAIGVHDAVTLILSGLVLASFFTTLSAVADLSRPRALYRPT
ncbi:MAG: ABC transporter permease subunit [Candidatus Limnocylindria bacterium]